MQTQTELSVPISPTIENAVNLIPNSTLSKCIKNYFKIKKRLREKTFVSVTLRTEESSKRGSSARAFLGLRVKNYTKLAENLLHHGAQRRRFAFT